MLRTRTDFWGAAFISSLGLAALGCSSGNDSSTDVAAANGDDDASDDDATSGADDDATSDDDTQSADDDTAQSPGSSAPNDDDSATPSTTTEPGSSSEPAPNGPSSGPTPGPQPGSGGAAVDPAEGGAGAVPQTGPGGAGGASPNGPAGGSGGAQTPNPQGGAAGEPATQPSQCANSESLLAGTTDTGLETCADGVIHRPAAVQCANNLADREPPTGFAPVPLPDGGVPGGCQTDADCTAAPYGLCQPMGQIGTLECMYGCVEDADCAATEVCVCGPDIGFCKAATCRTDDDCAGNALCAEWYDRFGIGCDEPPQYACQTPQDECATSQDCVDQGTGDNCAVVDGVRACVAIPSVACGRPFLVHGKPVLAEARIGGRARKEGVSSPTLSASERSALAHHWTQVGLMEHASIAAFARFCLQLLQLGAPSELLIAAQTAMADESAHTDLAFDLASRYAGQEISAGPLPLTDADLDGDIETILRLVIHEGCVGETVAALEAVEARAHCSTSEVSCVLERIARDEQNHAALAWRFVAWAIEQQARLRDVAEREFRRIAEEAPCATPNAAEPDLSAHGALPLRVRNELREAAVRDVVVPCAKRLLGSSMAPRPAQASVRA